MATQTNMVFKRIEKKFLLSEEQYNALYERIKDYITLDDYGIYTICNVYYDTKDNDLVSRSIEKPKYKEKLRVRSYGIPGDNDKIFVEIKKKYDHVVYKRRIKIHRKEWLLMLKTKSAMAVSAQKFSFTDRQILKEIEYFIRFYDPQPKMYIAYDRTAYYCNENKELRITFDRNIRGRLEDIDLTKGDDGDQLLGEGECLMEIKVPGAYPVWLARILSEEGIYSNSFSKYGNLYKKYNEIRRNENAYEYTYNTGVNNYNSNNMYSGFTGTGTDNSIGVYVHQ